MHKKEIFLEIDANLHQPIQSMEADSNSRAIRFYLTSNYAPLNLRDKKVIFKAVKPDSTDIVNDCEIIDVEKGIVEIKVTKQLNAVPGRVNCQLSIIGANDYVLKTKKFGILVDSKLTESGIISSREYKTLENALSEVHEINKNFEQVNAKINEVATKGTTVEVIEEVTKEEIERQIADGTIAHLMIEDGSVTPEKTSFYDEIATQKNLLKNAEFDYMGNNQNTVKKAIDSSIDWVLGEVNTAHHEGQHITATDTIEGHAKSAILKGQTLVNSFITSYYQHGGVWGIIFFKSELMVKGKKYIIVLQNLPENCQWAVTNYDGSVILLNYTDQLRGVFTSSLNGFEDTFALHINDGETIRSLEELQKVKPMLIEYQEGMENWDIPYFEGMTSVKMPVLTTTGKNLLDVNGLKQENAYIDNTDGNIKSSNGHIAFLDYIAIPNNGNILFFNNSAYSGVYLKLAFYDINKTYISGVTLNTGDIKASIPSNAKYCRVSAFNHANGFDLQLEVGDVKTSYEPFKSNILSTSEDVVLRGIGNVEDELNLLTGEVTQRIGEIVLDGDEIFQTWITGTQTADGMFGIYFKDENIDSGENGNGLIICDKLPISYRSNLENTTNNSVIKGNGYIGITMNANSHNEVKEWLSQNPITVQYRLRTESIKTVDLSDNHVYSYEGTTHYDCSSAEGSLVPTLSIDVPTNLPAVVTRQRATIQELEKENVALKNEIEETANSSVNGDLELMSSQFELDFRLFEIEMNLDMPMMATMRGVKSMAMTVYQQAKTLILAGKYEREDMEYKLNRYKAAGRITVEEYEELIALMDARELVD